MLFNLIDKSSSSFFTLQEGISVSKVINSEISFTTVNFPISVVLPFNS